ncbi:MAG: cyanophycinase [Pseudomonadota bacterium]|nr:cyanophycinase [Pseudomonadota bacterium]
MRRRWTLIASFLSVFAFQAAHAEDAGGFGVVTRGPGWTYTRLGNQTDVQTKTTFGVLFEGGGKDVNAAYQWMCGHANGGDFLVIRASGTADYNPYILRLCPGINSVSTLKITSRLAAFQPFVQKTILRAEALFIAGGDQADYVRFYQQTPVNTAIDALARRGVPVGGTSAGNAILGQFAFSALANGTITSQQALRNPFDFRITLDNGFLFLGRLLADTITDDHFITRDRMGRLVTFLGRIAHDHAGRRPYGIALDENTAFLMEANGKGTVVGSSTVYFLRTPGRPEICEPETRLTYRNLAVYRIAKGGTFDVDAWAGTGGTAYDISAIKGDLTSTQPGGSVY